MFNTGVLDIVIGLIFIYLLYSLLATIIHEMLASVFSFRAKILERAIIRMLEDDNKPTSRVNGVIHLFKNPMDEESAKSAADAFYNHPLIKFLGENKRSSKPGYITRETFSKVLVDLLRGEDVKPGTDIRPLIQKALDEGTTIWGGAQISAETLSYLKSIWADAQGDVERFREHLENWFDETMDRATGWYKKNTQFILFFIGLTLAIVFNVDTIKIAGKLEKDPKLREQLVQQADAFTKAHPNLDQEISDQKAQLAALQAKVTKKDIPPAVVDSIQKIKFMDSLALKKYTDLEAKRSELLQQADSLVKNDIGKANNILGIGLNNYECSACDWKCFLKSLLGWVITAMALSLGAPFWFDMLNKIMKVRNSIASSTQEEKQKQDPQSPKIKRVG
ncbi:MAG: hypothetical protein ACOYNC_10395 [Bacteroidales bacterium]